ncbi:hypothetical protein ACMX2H_07840 [Arthrobacter sulfonylureivorans]
MGYIDAKTPFLADVSGAAGHEAQARSRLPPMARIGKGLAMIGKI